MPSFEAWVDGSAGAARTVNGKNAAHAAELFAMELARRGALSLPLDLLLLGADGREQRFRCERLHSTWTVKPAEAAHG